MCSTLSHSILVFDIVLSTFLYPYNPLEAHLLSQFLADLGVLVNSKINAHCVTLQLKINTAISIPHINTKIQAKNLGFISLSSK